MVNKAILFIFPLYFYRLAVFFGLFTLIENHFKRYVVEGRREPHVDLIGLSTEILKIHCYPLGNIGIYFLNSFAKIYCVKELNRNCNCSIKWSSLHIDSPSYSNDNYENACRFYCYLRFSFFVNWYWYRYWWCGCCCCY